MNYYLPNLKLLNAAKCHTLSEKEMTKNEKIQN